LGLFNNLFVSCSFLAPTMNCPFCLQPAQEDAAECSHCGLSLPKLDQFFGVPPKLHHGINDPRRHLSGAETRRIRRAIARFHVRFPQAGFTVHLSDVAADWTMPLYAFWVLNRSTLCADLKKGSLNREILLCIDPQHRRAALTVGYGLEPFVGRRHLQQMLEAAGSELSEGRWAMATLTVIDQCLDQLTAVHSGLRRTYGAENRELGAVPAEGELAY
jgi:hypothetical protein